MLATKVGKSVLPGAKMEDKYFWPSEIVDGRGVRAN